MLSLRVLTKHFELLVAAEVVPRAPPGEVAWARPTSTIWSVRRCSKIFPQDRCSPPRCCNTH